jgi:hypothetical protein
MAITSAIGEFCSEGLLQEDANWRRAAAKEYQAALKMMHGVPEMFTQKDYAMMTSALWTALAHTEVVDANSWFADVMTSLRRANSCSECIRGGERSDSQMQAIIAKSAARRIQNHVKDCAEKSAFLDGNDALDVMEDDDLQHACEELRVRVIREIVEPIAQQVIANIAERVVAEMLCDDCRSLAKPQEALTSLCPTLEIISENCWQELAATIAQHSVFSLAEMYDLLMLLSGKSDL